MAINHNDIISIRDMERAHITSVLVRTKWRIEGPSGAATILGINPSTLRFRMKKLGISHDPGLGRENR